jgi:phosphoribosylanthranilate isomerase
MKTKICGLKEPDNIAAIAELAPDYMGFVFYPKSPRYAAGDKLRRYLEREAEALTGIARVGVFVNEEIDQILSIAHDYQLNYVQLHGDESPAYCQELQLLWSVSSMHRARIIKAFRISENFDWSQVNGYAAFCPLFIFDTKGAQPGGTGEQWDWSLLDNYSGVTPFLLSGGVGPQDRSAIAAVTHPQFSGVDLNSKFETAPGHKDVELLRDFVTTLK